jgi:hypothetical protein
MTETNKLLVSALMFAAFATMTFVGRWLLRTRTPSRELRARRGAFTVVTASLAAIWLAALVVVSFQLLV